MTQAYSGIPVAQRLASGSVAWPCFRAWPAPFPVPSELEVLGDPSCLNGSMIGFLCSRRAPGAVVIAVHDWARAARDAGAAVISGFQSPLERDVLRFLLRGSQPIVVCPARDIGRYRVPAEWREPLGKGRLTVVSPFGAKDRRITARLASERNRFVAAVAETLIIAHATSGGALAAVADEMRAWGKEARALTEECA